MKLLKIRITMNFSTARMQQRKKKKTPSDSGCENRLTELNKRNEFAQKIYERKYDNFAMLE